jgi:hypothetical protein
MLLNHIMLHIGLTFSVVTANAIPGAPIRKPHGKSVYLLLQGLLMLQATSLCIGVIMALLKRILWGIGPPSGGTKWRSHLFGYMET